MAFEVTPLTIEQVVHEAEQSKTLYVTNNSGHRYDNTIENKDGTTGAWVKQTLALVHVNYRNSAGDLTAISVPPTWVPVNMAAFAKLDALLASENFLSLLRKNILVAISKTDAERILQTSEAQVELQKHANQTGVVNSNGRMAIPMKSFRVGPSSDNTASDDHVVDMPVNHEALEALLQQFNSSAITDAIATERFANLNVSLKDIQANMPLMQDTASQLFGAMIARIETLEARESKPAFPQ